MNTAAKEGVVEEVQKSIMGVDYHARLLADINNIAAQARIPVAMLHQSATKFCGKEIIRWLKNWQDCRDDGRGGLCLTGVPKEISISDQLAAITAVFVRHYIDARMITFNRVLENMGTENEETPTILVIPDVYIQGQAGAKGATNFQQQDLYGLLLERASKSKLSILYVQDLDAMRHDYGPVIADHIASNFDQINLG